MHKTDGRKRKWVKRKTTASHTHLVGLPGHMLWVSGSEQTRGHLNI